MCPRTMGGMTSFAEIIDRTTADELRARGSWKWAKGGPGVIGAFVAEMDFGVAPPVEAALLDVIERRDFGLPQPARVGRDGGRVRALAAGPLRLGGGPGTRPPAARRDHRPRRGDQRVLPPRQPGDPADPRLHAVPHLAGHPGPGDHPGPDGGRRRALRPGPRRHRRGVQAGRPPARAVQSEQPGRPGVRRGGARRRRRRGRGQRRPGVRRRDPRAAAVPRRQAHPLRRR